jgi:hypothetical protein
MQRESESAGAIKIRYTNSAFGPRDKSLHPARATLDPEQSAKLREQLLASVAQLQSEEEAADWVHKNMPAKNTLIAADADLVESAFKDKLTSIQSMQAFVEEPASSVAGEGLATAGEQIFGELMEASVAAPSSGPRNQKLAAVASQRKLSACAIRSTVSSSPLNRALSVAVRRAMRTIFASPNRVQLGARSVTSIRSRSVDCITVIFTPTVMKPLGGLLSASIRCP